MSNPCDTLVHNMIVVRQRFRQFVNYWKSRVIQFDHNRISSDLYFVQK